MSALSDYGRVADAVLANKNTQRENDRVAAQNLQGSRLSAESSMQGARLGAEEKMQGQRIDATTALAGVNHTNDMAKLAETDKFKTAEQGRAAGAAALLAGGNEAVAANMINNQAGFPSDPKGLNIPLKTNQQDQFQFVTQDAPVGTNQPAAVFAGNKQTGQLHQVSGAAANLAGGAAGAQRQAASPVGGAESGAEAGQGNPAADAFSKIYTDNPQRLKEDAAFAVSQIGTVHKTPEEQKKYLLAMRQSNPTLFNSVYQSLQQ